MKTILALLVVIGLGVGGLFIYRTQFAVEAPPNYRTVEVKLGTLLSTISATGTVEPEEVVDVGAQVVGRVKEFGKDDQQKRIDYGSTVHVDTELAYIDDAMYRAQLEQAEAALLRAKRDLLQFKAKAEQTKKEWERAKELFEVDDSAGAAAAGSSSGVIKGIAETDYDLANANFKIAEANVQVGEAAIKQAEASLSLAKTNLDYTVIKSPVEGVIVDRRVNIGQTVVASLNAPSIFLIAKDLTRMQVWASVNEADIGRIKKDMPVKFTVDTYPGTEFRGQVLQIRLNATMTQNVVTYTVVVVTDNSDLKLLPYLTANLQFEVDERKDVLMVPNSALRWRPRPPQMAPDIRDKMTAELSTRGGGKDGRPSGKPTGEGAGKAGGKPTGDGADKAAGRPAGEPRGAKPERRRDDRGRVWVKDGAFVRPIEVQIGATDGTSTEIKGEEIKDGLEVVIGEIRVDRGGSGDVTNPFAPKLFQGRPKQ